jgi:hypothetical protein
VPPGLVRGGGLGLQEGLADCGGDHGMLALRHVRQGVPDPMNATALPCRAEHASDRGEEARARLARPKNRGPDQCTSVIRSAIAVSDR